MNIAHDTLVLVADGGKALLFRNEGDEKFLVLKTLCHEETATPPNQAIGSDRPGRSFSSHDGRRSAYQETDWHRAAEEQFARQAAEILFEAAHESDADLVMISPPRFLGWLRDFLPKELHERVVAEIPKDLVHRDTNDIAKAIDAFPQPEIHAH
jgi:protein required for attachment to host cells